jgi:hypothetical protein
MGWPREAIFRPERPRKALSSILFFGCEALLFEISRSNQLENCVVEKEGILAVIETPF